MLINRIQNQKFDRKIENSKICLKIQNFKMAISTISNSPKFKKSKKND